jgi:hypothetical protein
MKRKSRKRKSRKRSRDMTANPRTGKPGEDGREASILEAVIRWLIFGVLISLAPFLAVLLDDIDRGIDPTLVTLFGSGELLIVSAVIAAAGIGELFRSAKAYKRRIARQLVLGSSIVNLLAASLWFADVSSLIVSKQHTQPTVVAAGSIGLFISTVVASTSALLLSEA